MPLVGVLSLPLTEGAIMAEVSNPAGPTRSRLCRQEDLDAMCRTGIELMHEAIDSRDAVHARETYVRIVDARRGLVGIMNEWTASTLHWVLDEHGPRSMADALDPDLWLELGLRLDLSLDETVRAKAAFSGDSGGADRMRDLVATGDTAGAKELWDGVDTATLKLHDYRIDWLTSVISHVYRAYGADGLYAAMLNSANAEWWRERMIGDLAELGDPVQRITNWSFFLGVGNWGTVSVTETDDAFVIHHQVCGSCGRQELRRCHEAPVSFPRVTEPIPGLNFGDTNYTIYRTHLAVWHFMMPIGEVGHPWPAINCLGVPGRCWFTIYKDPINTPAWYYERAGLTKPGR